MGKRSCGELTEPYMVEQSAINHLKKLNYLYIHGSELTPEKGERESYRHVILKDRFINAIKRINPFLTNKLAEEVYKKITNLDHPDLIMRSKKFYDYLINGVKITIKENNNEKTKIVKLIDFENIEKNEYLASNQFRVEYYYKNNEYRIPDLVIFINGIPIAVFEFKNFNSNETAKDAFYDHKIKMNDIPQLYTYAQILVVSDGLETKYGSITSDWDRFFVWEGIFDDNDLIVKEIEKDLFYYIYKPTKEEMTSLEVILKGLFRKEHLTEYIRDFILYEKSGEKYIKKIAMFHQFYAVRKAVKRTIEAIYGKDKRIGVVWHTQGSGKSLTMLFYARKVMKVRELKNPLLLFITDRRDLDEQLYKIFANSLPIVKRAESIKDLQDTIKSASGGIIFATIQKFGKRNKDEEYPFLTDRKNIIVIADEAHRSQYRELAMNLRKAIPNASFMGFTATPIELRDKSTTLVFGDYISIYSMDKARRHGVVVPIYYEPRLVELHLTNEFIDEEFEEISESILDEDIKESLKKKFARLEKLIMAEDRLNKIAKDIVEHFNKRREEFKGKAMVVTISRKVAVKLYEKIKEQPNAPTVAVVISGSKNEEEFKEHIRNKRELEELAEKFKNPDSDPQMVIVVDMWLTGFDVPCLHTMYFDKPMKNHSLLQAIARVNRVFKDKPGGLIVDYIGIADNLRKSLSMYAQGDIDDVFTDINVIINQLKEKYDIVSSYFYGINWKDWKKLSPEELSKLTTKAYDRVCINEDTKKRFVKNFIALKRLYALASPHPEAYKIKDDLRFFEMIKKMIVKYSTRKIKEISRDLEYEMNYLISKSISAEEPIDVFALLGKDKPELSIFDEELLSEFKNMQYKNYAVEVLSKIINDQIRVKMRVNPIRYRSFYEMLKKIIEKYNTKLITTAEVLDELIKLAIEIKKAVEEGKKLNLSEEELSFYDLLSSKEKIFENREEIEKIAKEIVKELSPYIKVADWNKKEYLKAKIRKAVKKILIRNIGKKITNKKIIDNLSTEIIKHAEIIYSEA